MSPIIHQLLTIGNGRWQTDIRGFKNLGCLGAGYLDYSCWETAVTPPIIHVPHYPSTIND